MNIFFIGSVLFSKIILEQILTVNELNIIGIATKKSSSFNSDHIDLSSIAIENKIPYKYVSNINDIEILSWIKSLSPDVIYCFGWSSLIKKKLLDIPKKGVIGYHPAKLPKNRGRHPIIWTLVLGLKETASTFFKMDEGADTGDIISQIDIKVSEIDNAKSLYNKLIESSKNQILNLSRDLASDKVNWIKQSNKNTNYWRKRSKLDGKINFSNSSKTILNLVKALSKPYPGSHLLYDNKEVKIWECRLGPKKEANLEPGKILEVSNNQILVKTADGSVWITKHEFQNLPSLKTYFL